MEQRLYNVHELLTLSAQMPIDATKTKTEVLHVRIEKELKEAAEAIIARHTSTPSAFIRKCYEALVREYLEG